MDPGFPVLMLKSVKARGGAQMRTMLGHLRPMTSPKKAQWGEEAPAGCLSRWPGADHFTRETKAFTHLSDSIIVEG